MKAITVAGVVAAFFLMMATAPTGRAQRGHMMMGNYDTKTEVTIQGTVDKINRMGKGPMPGMGIHLIVKAGNETTEVHLGPADFVEKTMAFKEGDAIQVTGSKVTMMDRTVVIAREVKKGDEVLKLRDEQGVPLWRGMHRRFS
jgi:hypothetical protein